MKFYHKTMAICACLSIVSCQTALYRAVDDDDAMAVRRELAAGANPYEKAPSSNWWWKGPMLPLAFTADVAEIGFIVGTLGVGVLILAPFYGEIDQYIIADFGLTEGVWKSGKVTPVDKALDNRSEAVCWALIESGKVHDQRLKDHVLHSSLMRHDYIRAAQVIAKGANPNTDRFCKSLLVDAFEKRDEETVRFLVKHGADINLRINGYGCRTVAEANNMLPLYKKLGGKMVTQ